MARASVACVFPDPESHRGRLPVAVDGGARGVGEGSPARAGGAGHGINHPGGDFVLDVGRCGVDDLPRRNPISAPTLPESNRTQAELERAGCVAGLLPPGGWRLRI